jgi:hypothetical protein
MSLKSSPIFSEEALVTWQFDALFSLSKVIWLNDHQTEQKKGAKVKAILGQ